LEFIRQEKNIEIELPILGQEHYLSCKSNYYGWFRDEDYIIAFFIDKRLIFKRLVFTTGVIKKKKDELNREKEFLDDIITYVKKYKMCDFISKAQANVIFNECPKNVQCVPWGTYELTLERSKQELFSSFSQKSRNVIRKAIKSGVTIERSKNIKLVYQNIKETLTKQHSIHYPSLNYLNKIYKLQNNVVFFVAKKDNIIQGSLVLSYDKFRGYAMYAGSIKRPQTGSIDLLHFEAMQFLQNKNVKMYDLMGTRIHIQKGSKQDGINKFKKKFNPNLVQGYAFRIIIRPFKYFLYYILSELYFKFNNIIYKDPILEILEDEKF